MSTIAWPVNHHASLAVQQRSQPCPMTDHHLKLPVAAFHWTPMDGEGKSLLSTNPNCSRDVRKKTRRHPFSASYSTALQLAMEASPSFPGATPRGGVAPVFCLSANPAREWPARTRDERLVKTRGDQIRRRVGWIMEERDPQTSLQCSWTWILHLRKLNHYSGSLTLMPDLRVAMATHTGVVVCLAGCSTAHTSSSHSQKGK
ncbi:uncharacterized protein LY89DRAFT_733229 [Mollisia scopiformis]|uniref:Uncharacterized protein n=1 Tax=Mollisia scopiformis TaxID=149040 RepID=A0A194XB23_MOLSC|nr:uncharacterized protein LY89DRAFT_733229 [Mollisia scopiformis]KUJ17375.1 hypothetical protein LY89DRAFT_733229 [Mollisia scopiformis]